MNIPPAQINNRSQIKADLWLLVLTAIWGTSFPLVKIALRDIGAPILISMRFWIGGICLGLFILIKGYLITRRVIRDGMILGVFMFAGIFFQTVGLKYTTAAKSGFLTGLSVVFVPILVIAIEKRRPHPRAVFGAVAAAAGVFILTSPKADPFNIGDLFTLLCAVSFAFQIIFVEMLVRKKRELSTAFCMILTTAILGTISIPLTGDLLFNWSHSHFFILFWISVVCTAFAFWMQIKWQPGTTATTAAVIYTMEPVFALLFAMVFIGEKLSPAGFAGGLCIMFGILIAESGNRPFFQNIFRPAHLSHKRH